jgi:DNA-binding GntR family transcriptional regulator
MKSVNTDVAYNYIRKRILNGEFAPGSYLMTEVLAKDIKVSRTPIRDALRKLETDGLVTIRAHLGASVKQMNIKEFREMSDLRLALESHAAGLAASHRTESDLREIQLALKAMQGLTEQIIAAPQEQALLSELIVEDVRFHIAIMAAAKNDLMRKEILRLHLLNRVISSPARAKFTSGQKLKSEERRRAVQAMHEKIYDAILRSDVVAARNEMAYHLQELINHNLMIMSQTESGRSRELTADELAYNT